MSVTTLVGKTDGDLVVKANDITIPEDYQLYQNYPNPFNPSTIIQYRIPENTKRETLNVKLTVFDVLGRKIKTLVDAELNAGNYEVTFDAADLTSGLYIYKLDAGSTSITKKMTLLK